MRSIKIGITYEPFFSKKLTEKKDKKTANPGG